MTTYTIRVTELQSRTYDYLIEADSEEEAMGLAEAGETVSAALVRDGGVVDRVVEDWF